MSNLRRSLGRIVAMAILALVWLGGCGENTGPGVQSADSVIVSNPVPVAAAAEDGYEVIADDGYGDQWLLAELPANATSVEVSVDWVNGYYLFVIATKDGGWSDPSNWFPYDPPPPWWGNSVRAGAAPASQPKRPMLRRAKP